MNQLVAVVGNAGAGKTTLTRLLVERCGLTAGLEQHAERPFQALFAADLTRYALANQVDYLLERAAQEDMLRAGSAPGIQDGGLDEDFWVFTQRFAQQGYLTPAEFALCERLYRALRQHRPPPELIIWVDVPVAVAHARLQRRARSVEIARPADLAALDGLLRAWLARVPPAALLRIDATADDPSFSAAWPALTAALNAHTLLQH